MNLRYVLPVVTFAALAAPQLASAHDARRNASIGSADETNTAMPTIRMLTRVDVDTSVRQPITNGCEVQSLARGSYSASNPDGRAAAPLRDVDITGVSVLVCDGNEVRAVKQRFVFPTLESREQLSTILGETLTTRAPGSDCAWTPQFQFSGEQVRAASIANSCAKGDAVAALQSQRAWDRVDVGAPWTARGGGPAEK